ncbi:ABC transporter substrate-binding protein [Phytohabitans kaempferiae]|uniref:ABC transporter substrate-binding protein n=1 Tax=Phytohabitans kaempferiae TaxID=1620943 RepID=A0ABV6M9I4_9ACTN
MMQGEFSRRSLLRFGLGAAVLGGPAAAMLSGCGGDDASDSSRLRVYNWGSAEEGKVYDQAFDRFEAARSGITAENNITPVTSWADYADKLAVQIAGGSPPDLINMAVEGTRLAVDKKLLMPLGPVLGEGEVAGLLEKMPASLREAFTVDGELYAVPNGWQTMVIYCNTKMFADQGIPLPSPDWTWDDFLALAKRFTGGGTFGFGMPWGFFQLHPWWLTNGAYPVSDDYRESRLTDPAFVEAVTFVHDLVRVHKVSPDPTSVDVYAQFAAGKFAMIGAGRWPIPTWKQANFADFAAVRWPKKVAHTTVFGGAGWGISPKADASLAAAAIGELVGTTTITEIAAIGQQIPVYADVLPDSGSPAGNEALKYLLSMAEDSRPVAAPVFFNDLERITMRYLERIVIGEVSPADGLKQADAELRTAIR